MARDKGKNNPAEAANPVDDGNAQTVDCRAVEVQKDNPEKPVEKAAEKPVEKAGRNDYILRLMESRRKAMAGEK